MNYGLEIREKTIKIQFTNTENFQLRYVDLAIIELNKKIPLI